MSQLRDISLKEFKRKVTLARKQAAATTRGSSSLAPTHEGHAHTLRPFNALQEAEHAARLARNNFTQVQATGFSINDGHYFRDASEIASAFGLMGRAKLNWHWTDKLHGCIQGIPNMRGTLQATNGILCAIKSDDAEPRYLLGHIDHFIPDVVLDDEDDSETPAKPRKTKLQKQLSDYA